MRCALQSLFALVILAGCSKSSPTNPPPALSYTKQTVAYKSVSGVDPNLLSLDIYHFGETGPQRPVVVYVHGGAFALGDKANNMTNKQNLFSGLGYLLISVNYRLSPSVYSTDPTRIKYPTHHNDVADAVQWLLTNIATYGGNPDRLALLGHSAGAQLVSLTGTSSLFLPARGIPLTRLKGVASIDTEGYDVVARGNEGNEVYLNAFGQANTFWAEASPINQVVVGNTYPPFFIAKRGTAARIGYADAFISKLQAAGVSVDQVTGNQYDHEGINDAIGAPGETAITNPLKTFFARCFQ